MFGYNVQRRNGFFCKTLIDFWYLVSLSFGNWWKQRTWGWSTVPTVLYVFCFMPYIVSASKFYTLLAFLLMCNLYWKWKVKLRFWYKMLQSQKQSRPNWVLDPLPWHSSIVVGLFDQTLSTWLFLAGKSEDYTAVPQHCSTTYVFHSRSLNRQLLNY